MTGVNRREFLGQSAAVAGTLATPLAEAVAGRHVAASEKVVVALVGCGGMGRGDLNGFMRLPEVEVAAVCDVDPRHMDAAVEDIKKTGRPVEKVQREMDFRRVVERKDIDAVIVGTPDHWHAYVLIAACANNKDVYCEKPLSHSIVEGRAMVEAARRNKRVVQIGTQQRSGKHFQDAVAYIQSGKLGELSLCKTWIANRHPAAALGKPADENPPAGVDYDMWLGPAPKRPFNRNRFHHNFRWFWDYGNGLCNDWGVHLNDVILWATGAVGPLSVYACGGNYEMKDNGDTPDTLDIHYYYSSFTHIYTVRRGQHWYGDSRFNRAQHGMEFHGSRGVLLLDRGGWRVVAQGERLKEETHGGSDQHFPHIQNFVHCMRHRSEKTASDIEDMHRATVTAHLANISYRVGRRIYWDHQTERCYRSYDGEAKRFTQEDTEANAYLLREPRKPWSLTV